MPLSGSVAVTVVDADGAHARGAARRARRRSSPGRPTSPTCRRDCDVTVTADGRRRHGRRLRRPSGATAHAAVPARRRRRRARRAARGRRRVPRGPQLRHPRRARRRLDHRLRGHHARRQLELLPAAQARRGAAGRRDRSSRRSTTSRSQPASGLTPGAPRAAEPGLATCGSTAPRSGRSTCSPRCASGDVVLVPHGWHGPAMAAPGYDLYYLNVMAGPGAERAWLICDDPAHGWVRDTWTDPAGRPPTPPWRCSMTSDTADGRRRSGSPWPRPWCGSSPTSGASATASGRSSSPAASASSATATSPASARRCCRTSSPTVDQEHLPYVLARNEQAMVHTSVAYARQKDRLQTWACTASVGPGSTNMLTGAALATINRIPVLLLPSGTFATRVSSPVLQELEQPYAADVTVNDAFRPLSRFFDRVSRPEQLPSALLGAMRVLTDPVETGAVTDRAAAGRAGRGPRLAGRALRPAHVAGGPSAAGGGRRRRRRRRHPVGDAAAASSPVAACTTRAPRRRCGRSASRPASRSGRRQAGKGSLPHGHPQQMGAVGSTGHDRRQRARRRGRRRHRDRHAVERLHHGLADRLPGQGGPLRQHQRRPLRRGQALRAVGRRRRPRGAHRADRRPRGVCRRRRLPRRARPRCGPSGTPRSRPPTTRPPRSPTSWPTACSPRARCSAPSTS